MTASQEKAIALITAQQKTLDKYTNPWLVGEDLKAVCEREPDKAEIIAQDLAVPEMSLIHAEKKIKAWADENIKGKGRREGGPPPSVAEGILREFYGLGKAGERPAPASSGVGITVNLADFF